MLHALPFTTFGEAAALGLEAHVYCPSCFTTRRIDPMADRIRDRCFPVHQCPLDRRALPWPVLGDNPTGRAAARGR